MTTSGEPPTSTGVRRVLAILAMLAAVAAVPYLVPGLERLRVWTADDPVPFARVLDLEPFTAGAPVAGVAGRGAGDLSDAELLEAAVGPAASAPAPAASVGGDASLRIPPDAWAGMRRPIEDDAGSMRHAYGSLRRTALREPGATTRILFYSDSVNASDRVTGALRERLQARFGDGGKGFVPIVPGWPYQVHQDVRWSKRGGWRTRVVNTRSDPLGRYGLGGVLALNAGPGARASFGTTRSGTGGRVGRYRLFYQAWPEGGDVVMRVDGGADVRVATRAPAFEDRVHDLDVADGAHELELRVDGEARLYGVVMERRGPGVVVDALMLVGAFTRVLGQFDPDHWSKQIALREPDLMVFWLGGNDAASHTTLLDPERYVDVYTRAIGAARRGRPAASCLVMSVLDSEGARPRRVRRLVEAQRDVAREAGCAFFDTWDATGGRGTMARWSRTSPRLAEADGRHLTRPGARVVATLLEKALLHGYDTWLASAAPPPSARARR